MTAQKKKTLKKLIFPVGIFLLMFLAESIIGITGVATYFYLSGKKNIREIENYTINYSKTMAEAFSRVAEFSYTAKKYSSLKTLFHEKIEENTIDEAFFVLGDGKLIVHSNTTTEKELMGNIAFDEMAYNLDMILLPVQTKSRELILNNYNVVNKKIPFKRQERDLLKKYVYKDIDSTGWLFTKGVFIKEQPVGSVNFIISKDRIYNSIKASINQARYYAAIIIAVSMFLSLFISIIVLIRYRSIQKNALESYPFSESVSAATDTAPQIIEEKTGEDEEIIIPGDSEIFDRDIDFSIVDDFDVTLVEEDKLDISEETTLPETKTTSVVPLKKHDISADDEEYITVELLGEIESEPDFISEDETFKKAGKYIAPVINLENYKNSMNKEIRDAIPVREKR